jgi:hypothetical protein
VTSVLVISTNCCTVVIFIISRTLKPSPLNVFLLSLAFSDAIYGLSFGLNTMLRLRDFCGASAHFAPVMSRVVGNSSSIGAVLSLIVCTCHRLQLQGLSTTRLSAH